MSKLNKIVTNYPVELSSAEINNLISTLRPVVEAIAGGGGQGSYVYTPGDDNIDINNTQHTISLTTKAANQINTPIPTKVTDLTDSASYPKKTYVDETFQTKEDMAAYLTTANANETYQTTAGMSNYYDKTYCEDIFASKESLDNLIENYNTDIPSIESNINNLYDTKQDKLTFGYDSNDKISAINGSALAGESGESYQAGTDLKIDNNVISVDTNGNPHNDTNTHNFVEGSWTESSGYNSHAEGMATTAYGYAVHAQGMWTKFSSNKWSDNGHQDPIDIYWAPGAGATVEGYCNSTTSCPMSGTEGESDYGPVHGGVLKVIGNGDVVHDQSVDPDAHIHTLNPSDALVIFKDGTISAFGDIYKNDKKFITTDGIADGNSYAMTTTGWEAIQAGGQGIQQVIHDDTLIGNGADNDNKLGVALTAIQPVSGMTAYATTSLLYNVSGELKGMIPTDLFTKASADTLYQPIGNYVSSTDISDMATQTWVGNQGYLTQVPDEYVTVTELQTTLDDYASDSDLQIVSAGVDYVSAHAITAHQSLTNYYTKDETSGAQQLAEAFANLPGGGITEVTHDTTLTGKGNSTQDLGVAWSALSSNKIDSAKSANSAEYITNGTGYSGFDDISAKFGTLTSYVPYSATELPIGTSNTATTNAAAIGGVNSAIDLSFALGNGNSAKTTGCAIGESNIALNKSVAIGYQNTANYNVDIAIGYQCSSYDHAAAIMNHNIAKTYSFAAGDCNTAIHYSYAFGRGLKLDNSNDGAGNNSFGGLVFGGWNQTTANAILVLGNGTPSTTRDYMVLKKDYSFAFGEATSAQFVGSFAEGFHTSAIGVGVRAVGAYTRFSVSNTADHAIYDWEGRGVSVEGYANATTAHPLDSNNNKIHNGVLKVIGNGNADSNGITGSDAYILYRDGTVSAKQFQNADGSETINGTTYTFSGVDNIEILPLAATANTANFPNDNVLRFILES